MGGAPQPLSLEDSKVLKGLCCLVVMVHHFATHGVLNISFLGRFNDYLGPAAVGVFFFISAYGLCVNYNKRGDNYLKKLLFNNIPKLYLTEVGINLIYFFCLEFKRTTLSPINQILKILEFNFIDFGRYNVFSWFITSILILYILFVIVYFVFRKLKNKKVAPLVLCGLILIITILLTNTSLSLYVRAISCFSVGLIYATYYDKINNFLFKHFGLAFVCSLIIFVIFNPIDKEQLGAISVCFVLIVLLQKFYFKNALFSGLSKISLEIYLMHWLFFDIFLNCLNNRLLITFLIFICTIISSIAIHWVKNGIILMLSKIKNNSQKTLEK